MEMQVLNIPIAEILNMLIMLLGVAIVCIAAFSYQKRSSIRMQVAPWTKLRNIFAIPKRAFGTTNSELLIN